jgi:alpha-L-rhamnosidase
MRKNMQINDLRIEYLKNPLGIDTQKPLVTWKLQSDVQGDQQSGYRMICRTQNEHNVVLDTGKVATTDNFSTALEHAALQSHGRYRMELIVYDKADKPSVPMEATFSVGFLDSFNDHASWITQPNPKRFIQDVLWVTGGLENSKVTDDQGLCHAIYLRKGFTIQKEVLDATLYVCGLGFNHTYINGQKVGTAVLDPAQTDYHKGALYSTYDVARLIREGFNACLFVLGNGRHIKAYGYDPKPRGIALIRITYGDGSIEEIPTDTTWLSSSGPIKENSIYEGEVYDARDELTGWDSQQFETSSWVHAEQIRGYPLSAQALPQITVTQTIAPVDIRRTPNNTWIIDFGQNMSALVKTIIRNGNQGHEISLRFSELLDQDGNLLTATTREANTEDRYICAGLPEEHWLPSFTYHGFRYAELVNYPGEPRIDDFKATVVHTELERTGWFSCSEPLINNIHSMIQWSQRANVMGIPTDCPQREERMGWLGDVQLVSEQAMFNFDMAAFYRKFLRDIKVSQTPEGALSDVTPVYWSLYPADPAWGTAYPTLLWGLYEQYGDISALEEHFEGVYAYVNFLYRQTKDGVLKDFGKYGDWCPPASTFPKQTPMDLTSSWFLYKDTLTVGKIARVLANLDVAHELENRAELLLQAFNEAFNTKGQYITTKMSPIDRQAGMTSQVLPLALDMVPQQDQDKAFALLVDVIQRRFDYHIDTGIVGTRYLFDVLEGFGRPEIAYRMITQKTYPSWGYMLEMGATTLWERWEYLAGMGMNSHNHVMFGSVDAWFYKTLCGLKSLAPRWKEILARPYIPSQMKSAEARIDTPMGTVALSWQQSTDSVSIQLTVPVGSNLTLVLDRCPQSISTTITPKDGQAQPIEELEGNSDKIKLESGYYTIMMKRKVPV